MTVAGLAMAVTPLALWASPTLTAFYWVLATCAVSSCVVLVLAEFGPDEPSVSGHRQDRAELPLELTSLLQNRRELSREDLPELRGHVEGRLRDLRKPRND
ncbi:MAG: hypothetical protein AAGF81_04535 [Pseudomonadota bacterium]